MNEAKISRTVNLFLGYCRRVHGFEPYPFQLELAARVIRASLLATGEDIFAIVSRQAGKTDALVHIVEFLMVFAPELTGRPFRVGIFAPQKEQAKTDFDRLKDALGVSLREGFSTVVDPRESNAVTLQLPGGSFCYVFPLTETSHPESKTLDLVVYEEANKIKDRERKNKAEPMRTATNAPSLSIGVGGYQSNYFKRGVDKGSNLIKADYTEVIHQRQSAFERDGNPFHLNYERFVRRILNENGGDDEAFRTQYGLEFIVGGGSFIRPDELHALRGGFGQEMKHGHGVFAGLDTAKFPDRTVLTVKCPECRRILSWLRLQGDNYEDQFEIVCKRLSGYSEVISLAIDSTGQGDFMPDLFENRTDYDILRVKFSLQSKDAMAKNLLAQIRNTATKYPADGSREAREFEEEMLNLEREYKGEFLSVHAPDDPNAHDDYFASWMLCEWAHREFLENQPDVHILASGARPARRDFDDDDDE